MDPRERRMDGLSEDGRSRALLLQRRSALFFCGTSVYGAMYLYVNALRVLFIELEEQAFCSASGLVTGLFFFN